MLWAQKQPAQAAAVERAEADRAIDGATLRSRQAARYSLYAQLVLYDSLAIVAGFSLSSQVRGETWLSPDGLHLVFLVVPIYLVFSWNQGAFSHHNLLSAAESVRRSTFSFLVTSLIVASLIFLTQTGEMVSRLAFAIATGTSIMFLTAGRLLAYRWVQRDLGGMLTDELLIIDGVDVPLQGQRYCIHTEAASLKPDLSDPKMLERFANITDFFDRVVVACPSERQLVWSKFLKTVSATGEILVPESNDLGVIGISRYDGHETMVVSRGPLSLWNRIKKRLFDLAIAIPALVFLSPLLLVVAIAIKLDSRGPIFFRQQRVGQHNVMFEIFKFRSMKVERSDPTGAMSTQRDDNRISKVGEFIRKTSIDELPQLLNVIRGDMSVVGPRPHALGSRAGDELFWEVSDAYWMRHVLKPGMTGLAQIRGHRGATHRRSDLEERLQSDLEYLTGWRLSRDFAILFATARVLVHSNAY